RALAQNEHTVGGGDRLLVRCAARRREQIDAAGTSETRDSVVDNRAYERESQPTLLNQRGCGSESLRHELRTLQDTWKDEQWSVAFPAERASGLLSVE